MPKNKKKKSKQSEKLDWQLKFYVVPAKHKDLQAAISRAREHFFETGKSIPGVKIVGRWRNPDNKNPLHADWKSTEDPGQSLKAFHKTLHGVRGAFRSGVGYDGTAIPHKPAQRTTRVHAMQKYHSELRRIQGARRGMTYKQARHLYRMAHERKGKKK